jgi:hypothetical protein
MADQFSRMYDVERVGGDQRTRLAEMLRANALNAPQGQMVSGWYVPPSMTQNLNQLAQTALGTYMGASLDEERKAKTAELLRQLSQGAPTEENKLAQIPGIMPQQGEGQSTPTPLEQTPANQSMAKMPQYRPLTDEEKIGKVMELAQYNPYAAQIWSAQDTARQQRAMKLEDMAAQRQFQAEQNQLNREGRMDYARLAAGLAASNRVAPQDKPLTEYQGKAVTFGTRAAQSHNILNALENNVNPVSVAASRKGGMLVNWALDPQTRQVEQAQRDFINAVLRQESGAAIGQNEYESAARQYFPEPGDPPEVIAQKRASREAQIRGFTKQAGPAGAPDIISAFNTPYALPTSKEEKPAPAGRLGNQQTLPPSAQQGGWGIRPKQ